MQHLTGPIRKPAAGGAPRQLVILLHGYGADGQDLVELAGPLGALLPQAQFIAPDAPWPCEGAPFGRQWFSLAERGAAALWQGVGRAAPAVHAFIDRELAALRLDSGRLALVGFSQGAMLALHVGLARAVEPAAVAALSGRFVSLGAAPMAVSRPPVLLLHGQEDEVVPFACLAEAKAGLERRGVAVEAHALAEIGHWIDEQGLNILGTFLQRHFKVNQ
ncbi:MAG: prolyl oligopeptidase family serine peptidase [Azospirillaceae bacterium]